MKNLNKEELQYISGGTRYTETKKVKEQLVNSTTNGNNNKYTAYAYANATRR